MNVTGALLKLFQISAYLAVFYLHEELSVKMFVFSEVLRSPCLCCFVCVYSCSVYLYKKNCDYFKHLISSVLLRFQWIN